MTLKDLGAKFKEAFSKAQQFSPMGLGMQAGQAVRPQVQQAAQQYTPIGMGMQFGQQIRPQVQQAIRPVSNFVNNNTFSVLGRTNSAGQQLPNNISLFPGRQESANLLSDSFNAFPATGMVGKLGLSVKNMALGAGLAAGSNAGVQALRGDSNSQIAQDLPSSLLMGGLFGTLAPKGGNKSILNAEKLKGKISPLAQEARKYKSAEEFVKGHYEAKKGFEFGDINTPQSKATQKFITEAQKPEYQKIYNQGGNDEDVLKAIYNQAKGGVSPTLSPIEGSLPSQAQKGVQGVGGGDTLSKLATNVEERNNKLVASQSEAIVARETRDILGDGGIKLVNQLKQIAKSKAFQNGDIDTLQNSGKSKIVDQALEAIKEANPNITSDTDALDFALSLPTKSQTVVKRAILTPEDRALRIQALREQTVWEKEFGRPVSEKDQIKEMNQAMDSWRKGTLSKAGYDQLLKRNAQLADLGIIKTESGAVSASPGIKTTKSLEMKAQKLQEQSAKQDYREWQNAVMRESGVQPAGSTINQIVGQVKSSGSPLSNNPGELKDISGFSAGFRDVYRNFKAVFGDRLPEAKRVLLDPFDAAKGRSIDQQTEWANKLDQEVVKKLGIKKGSAESAAVQLYGEKQRDYGSLVKEFGQKRADNIVEADKFFRSAYDQLLDEVNQAIHAIYPNSPEKIIPKRQDYYRHFTDLSEGFQGLLNIFDTPAGISSNLAGVSYQTKPKSKFLSFAQKRLGMRTEEDAVGGFIDYIKSASYAKNIDPQIERFRALGDELASATAEGADSGKLNNFITFLGRFADDLSGKTNPADRVVQEWIPGTRTTIRALNWLNSRVKANTILGNAGSTVAQFANIPQGIASAGPVNSSKGLGRSLAGMFNPDNPIKQSNFIKERYFNAYDKFDTSLLDNSKKFAVWMTQIGDEMGTKFIWNSHYEKALAEGIKNPAKYADDITRSLVAGRGVGEVPIAQKSKMFQLVAPFQLEVANLWYVMKDMVDQKAFGKIATLFVMNYLFNRAAEQIRGSAVTFDPIQATIEALGTLQEENGALRAGGRLAGEVLSNVPLGQSVAAAYPEYGGNIGDTKLPTRKELFGRSDPTRFGSGLLATKALSDPLYKILPPFGGGQIKKTIEGLSTYNQGYSESSTGRVRFPIEKNTSNAVKSAVFGQYATPEARQYFKNEDTPLGDKQSEYFKNSPNKQKVYEEIIANRQYNSQNSSSGGSSSSAAEDDIARDQAKRTNSLVETSTKIFYPESGEIKSVQKDRPIYQAKLSGSPVLDKLELKKQSSSYTSKINDIVKLYELGRLSSEDATKQITQLQTQQKSTKLRYAKPKKAKKITIKVANTKATKITNFKLSKPKLGSFKLKKAPTLKLKNPKKLTIKSGKVKLAKLKKITKYKNTFLTG